MNRLLASVQKIRLYNLKNGYAYSSGPVIVILKVRSDILVALKWNYDQESSEFPKSHEDMHFASALFRYEKKNSVYVLKSTVIYFV